MKSTIAENRLACVALAVASGILVPFSLPNDLFSWGSPALGAFALVPLFLALVLSPSPRFTFLIGMVYGLLFHGISSYWLWFFKDFRLWTLGSTLLAYAIIYGGVCSWLSLAARANAAWRPLLLAIGWVAYEFMKSIGFLAFPYGLIAYSWNSVPAFNQLAEITGVVGPSFILAFWNAILAELVLSLPAILFPSRAEARRLGPFPAALPPRYLARCFAIAAACFAVSLGFGAYRLAHPVPSAKTLNAVVVQPAADSWSEGSESKRLASLLDLTQTGIERADGDIDLIVWTETTLDQPYDEVAGTYYSRIPKGRPLTSFIAENGIPLLTGFPKVISWDPLSASNSVALIGGNADFLGYYAKMHPVPFAESIPFIEYRWMRDFMGAAVGMSSGWTMGEDYVLFRLPLSSGGELRFATPICFEMSFADQCRRFSALGAEVLINLTNVSWSQRESAEIQHCVTAVYRAIENRRTVIQSTNAGVSCWIDASGAIRDPMPLFEPHSSFYSIPVQTAAKPTVYTRAGDALSWFLTAFFVLFSAVFIIRGSIGEIRATRALVRLRRLSSPPKARGKFLSIALIASGALEGIAFISFASIFILGAILGKPSPLAFAQAAGCLFILLALLGIYFWKRAGFWFLLVLSAVFGALDVLLGMPILLTLPLRLAVPAVLLASLLAGKGTTAWRQLE